MFLAFIQAQVQQVAYPPQNGMPLSAFETLLIGAIATMALGISGLVTYVIKSAGPKIFTAFEKRNEALISASEKTADAVSKIPEAIKSFEIALLGAEKRLVEKIDESHDGLVTELNDKRISDLKNEIRATSKPSIPGV